MKTPLTFLTLLTAATFFASPLPAADLLVDAKASAPGTGAADAPFASLADAFAKAAPGDTISLAAGTYTFAPPKKPWDGKVVTLRPAKEAAGKVTLSRLDGVYSFIRFEGLTIPESARIRNARWVQFVRCTFAPTEKPSFWGVSFMDSENCGLYGCTIQTLSSSQVSCFGSKNLEFRFNEITNGDSDAFQLSGDSYLLEGNYIHDFHPTPKAHPDGIQLANCKNFTIRGNVFDCPNMQTFFFSWTAKETTYENFLLENNVCTTAQYHGLTTHPSTDMVIRNNLFIPDAKHPDGSAAIDLKNMQGKLTVQNNIFYQLAVEPREQDVISNNLCMKKHWKSGLPGKAVLTTLDATFVDRGPRDYRLKDGSPAIGAADPKNVPATDILGRKRPAGGGDKPSIGPLEPQKDAVNEKPFMEMWKAYFAKMQAEVQAPEPKGKD